MVLDNVHSHQVLGPVLPNLEYSIDDVNKNVRASMVDLLLKIKNIRSIKYWDVVPVGHLLTRLEMDPSFICRRIVKLLFNSFHPTTLPNEVNITTNYHFN